jgi:hypothetical protein
VADGAAWRFSAVISGMELSQALAYGLQEDRHRVRRPPPGAILIPPPEGAMATEELLDPTDSVAVPRKTAPRPASLDGKVITLLDISKAKGDHLLARIEELLREGVAAKAIVRKKKPSFARPALEELRQQILQATLGATGLPRGWWCPIRSSRSRATRCALWPATPSTRSWPG